jgi:hypothetical protein
MNHTPAQLVEIIVQVRSGMLTATEAARRLAMSRKTYYQWESRALTGMLAALQPGQPGRPPATQDPEVAQTAAERDRLRLECEDLKQRLHIQRMLSGTDTRSKKKRGSDGSVGHPPATA